MATINCKLVPKDLSLTLDKEQGTQLATAVLEAYDDFWGQDADGAEKAKAEYNDVISHTRDQVETFGDFSGTYEDARKWHAFLEHAEKKLSAVAYELGLEPSAEAYDFEVTIVTGADAPVQNWRAHYAKEKQELDHAAGVPNMTIEDFESIHPENILIEIAEGAIHDDEAEFLDAVANFHASKDVYEMACDGGNPRAIEVALRAQNEAWKEVISASALISEETARALGEEKIWQSAYSQHTATTKAPAQSLGF